MRIDVGETHMRVRSDIKNHDLEGHIYTLRGDLKAYISRNPDFHHSLTPLKKTDEYLPEIVERMIESSQASDVGPMACVAGTISEMSLEYLIRLASKCSVVENGGDIAMINDRTVLCGIYSDNPVIGNNIAFKVKPRKNPLGICTSSGKIGHSISFGQSDCVTVLSKSASLADGLATRIANEVKGPDSESRVMNALESAENYRELMEGVMIISDDNVATLGRLPRIVDTGEFDVNI